MKYEKQAGNYKGGMFNSKQRWKLMTTKYEIKILKTIDKIGKNAVDSIANDGFFTYGYFKTLETTFLSNMASFYLVVHDGHEINAVVPCHTESFNHILTASTIIRTIMNVGDKSHFFPDRLLSCYSPYSVHSRILIREKNGNLDAVLKGIDELCKKERISFSSFQYVSEFDKTLMDRLQNFGYLKVSSIKTLFLDVHWNNFEDYLKGLDQKTRKNIKREIKKCKENGVKILEEREFGKISENLYTMQSNLFSKYNNGAKSPYTTTFIQKLSEHAKDKTKVFIAQKDGKLIGFSLSLMHQDVLDVFFCGFDYENQRNTDFAYFNLVYYEPIKFAIEKGFKRIHFRNGAEDVKLRRGCKQENNYWFIKCQNNLIRPLFDLSTRKNTLNIK
jgi:predicted N-acyltransferase